MNPRIVAALFITGFLAASAARASEGKAHGKADSRAPFPHRIMLLDEKGNGINPSKDTVPYSPAQTCGKCHDVSTVNQGWHFGGGGVDNGRPGEPWILLDGATRTQIPLSYRNWPGTYRPADLGLSDWQFTRNFARHYPGGGATQTPATQPADPQAYWKLSGVLENDCMACHDGGNTYSVADRELELKSLNYKYAPTRALGLGKTRNSVRAIIEEAEASGDDPRASAQAPKVQWDMRNFDTEMRATLNVTRATPAQKCYYCHTTNQVGPDIHEQWQADKDVHLLAGLTCVDCHRHGLDHQVVRGYEAEGKTRPEAAALSCRGCHMGDESGEAAARALGGRLGSPRPNHNGIPPIHFEKLACTACHSGPWPSHSPVNLQTSLAHELGLESFERTADSAPSIVAPIFLRSIDDKITPHKMVWPNFWGALQNDTVTPLAPLNVRRLARDAMKDLQAKPWVALTDEQIGKVLQAMTGAKDIGGEPVYVSGGRLYRRSADGKLSSTEHAAAKPYAWALAHDVRPAAQSLGVRGCGDCHATDSPIYFASVTAKGPVAANAVSKKMYELRDDSGVMAWIFAFTFNFRMMLKVISFAGVAILLGVLTLYGLRALGWLTSRMG